MTLLMFPNECAVGKLRCDLQVTAWPFNFESKLQSNVVPQAFSPAARAINSSFTVAERTIV